TFEAKLSDSESLSSSFCYQIVRARGTRGEAHLQAGYLNCFLLILRALILWSRVDGGIPSLAAAPDGPQTRPLVSTSAASIMSRSLPSSTPLLECTEASILNAGGN